MFRREKVNEKKWSVACRRLETELLVVAPNAMGGKEVLYSVLASGIGYLCDPGVKSVLEDTS